MLNKLKEEANMTYTENGALTYRSTFSDCLDLFAKIGAMRRVDDDRIVDAFAKAYGEDPDIAMKILFFARDIRGGLGERRVFRVIMNWLADVNADSVKKNIDRIAEYGRFDDVVELLDTKCADAALECIRKQLEADVIAFAKGEEVSLLAKWLPSVNASNAQTITRAKAIARGLGMSAADYRKTLSMLRKKIGIIENDLREKDYTFDYSKQPSKAMYKYRSAFCRNDFKRYMEFLDSVEKGEAKLNTSTLMPYDIIAPIVNIACRRDCVRSVPISIEPDVRKAMDVSWNALEDFTDGRNALAVIDGSGSMYGPRMMVESAGNSLRPATVALSLGMYFAERCTGAFANHFITFSENPRLVEIKGRDIVDRTLYCESFSEIANTDLQKVFELLLKTAIEGNVPQDEMPDTVYIISDMEFDCCICSGEMTNFEYAKRLFEAHGYSLPQVVFWNVAGMNDQLPVTMNEQGVQLISGFTPRLFSVVAGQDYDPYDFMMEVIGSERYAAIAA